MAGDIFTDALAQLHSNANFLPFLANLYSFLFAGSNSTLYTGHVIMAVF